MAIGEMGIKGMVKSGARLTICLTVSLTILECILNDQTTMSQVIGHVASDLIKVGISALLSSLVGIAVGSVITVAVVPIFVTIFMGVIVGGALERIDSQYGLTDKLVAVLEKYSNELEQKVGRTLHESERELMWRGYGFDTENPLRLNTD